MNLPGRNPEAAAYLEDGGFSGSTSGLPHSNVPMDQLIETTIKRFSESTCGIAGKTEDPGACEKWTRLNHSLCVLKEYMDCKIGKVRHVRHIELGKTRIVKDSADVQSIVSTLISWVPKLYSDSQPLINISNGCPATPELINNVKTMYSRGKTAQDLFFLEESYLIQTLTRFQS